MHISPMPAKSQGQYQSRAILEIQLSMPGQSLADNIISSFDWVRFRLCSNSDANIEKMYTVLPLMSSDKKTVIRSGMLEGILALIQYILLK